MPRTAGRYEQTVAGSEAVSAFVPAPLPPRGPELGIDAPPASAPSGARPKPPVVAERYRAATGRSCWRRVENESVDDGGMDDDGIPF